MLSFKASLKILLLVSTFLLLFSTTVFANDVVDIKYVYYEDDGIVSRIYVIDYQDALEENELYDRVAGGVYNALMNNNQIWLETEDGDVIDYSKAINNHKSYEDVVGDDEYSTDRPDPDYEYYYNEDDERVARRTPEVEEPEEVKDDDYPNWLVVLDDDADDKFKYHIETWEPISKHLLVEIEIDREIFADEVSSRTIRDVKIDGYDATRKETDDDAFRWFVGIPIDDLDEDANDMPKDDVFELKPGMIEVRAGIRWY